MFPEFSKFLKYGFVIYGSSYLVLISHPEIVTNEPFGKSVFCLLTLISQHA